MKVLITGASGFVGGHLCAALEARGDEVAAVGRGPRAEYGWADASLAAGVAQCDVLIHLAGANLFGRRWSPAYKRELVRSRVETTGRLARLIARGRDEGKPVPRVFLSTSAVGYYGASGPTRMLEGYARGGGFLAELCEQWESAAGPAAQAGVRTCIPRLGVVLGPDGGAWAKMRPLFRLGLGGRLGSGEQWMSWIHVADLVLLFLFLIDHEDTSGVYNATAPNPVTNAEFTRALSRALHRPAFLATPEPVLRLVLGEAADMLLTGQHVTPARALEAGFEFRFPSLDAALADIASGATKPAARAGV